LQIAIDVLQKGELFIASVVLHSVWNLSGCLRE
jgi:hypothetical protein